MKLFIYMWDNMEVKSGKLKVWLLEPRPPFLLLSVCLVSLGTVIAWYNGFFNFLYFALALGGMLLAHISVDVLNDYFDYKSGLDLETEKTPFSGGSGFLPNKLLNPKSVYILGVVCLLLATIIGIYFVMVWGWIFIPLMIVGAVISYFYSTHFAKYMVGEALAGLSFGPLAVLGAYFVQTGIYSLEALVASLAPGILTANLLLLNEFPDMSADMKVGRKNLVIFLGKRKASRLYSALIIASYLAIIIGVVAQVLPLLTLVALGTTPLAIKAMKGALRNYDNAREFIPVMAVNVMMILITQSLLALGYTLATVLSLSF